MFRRGLDLPNLHFQVAPLQLIIYMFTLLEQAIC